MAWMYPNLLKYGEEGNLMTPTSQQIAAEAAKVPAVAGGPPMVAKTAGVSPWSPAATMPATEDVYSRLRAENRQLMETAATQQGYTPLGWAPTGQGQEQMQWAGLPGETGAGMVNVTNPYTPPQITPQEGYEWVWTNQPVDVDEEGNPIGGVGFWQQRPISGWAVANRPATTFAATGTAPMDEFGRTATWNARTGSWDYPPNFGQRPATYQSPREEQQAAQEEAYRQAQLDLQRQQLALQYLQQQTAASASPRNWLQQWMRNKGGYLPTGPQLPGWAQQGWTGTEMPWFIKSLQTEQGMMYPSPQFWNKLSPSEQEALLGYVDAMGIPPDDFLAQIGVMNPQVTGATARYRTPWSR